MGTENNEEFTFKNASDGTEDNLAVPAVTQESVYNIEYFGRADVLTALYTLVSQPWLPYIIIDIKYIESDDPSEPADRRISKGFGRVNDFTWEQFVSEERKIMQMQCRIYPDKNNLNAYIHIEYSYLSELMNNGYPRIQADFKKAAEADHMRGKIFDILRSAGIGVH